MIRSEANETEKETKNANQKTKKVEGGKEESVELEFDDDAIHEMAAMSAEVNTTVENIGARCVPLARPPCAIRARVGRARRLLHYAPFAEPSSDAKCRHAQLARDGPPTLPRSVGAQPAAHGDRAHHG